MTLTTVQKEIIEHGDHLFNERRPLLVHWQEIAENFYYDRADFTVSRGVGEDYAHGSFSSYASLARRELGNVLKAMLRSGDWYSMKPKDDSIKIDRETKAFIQWMTGLQRNAMYDPMAGFVRATSEADHDFVTFGNSPINCDFDLKGMHLTHKCCHLRDVVWSEQDNGMIGPVYRQIKMDARVLLKKFGDKLSANVKRDLEKAPFSKVNCRHMVVYRDEYDFEITGRKNHEFVSIIVDMDHQCILEQKSRSYKGYVIPRWFTVSGSQYARSMATDIILPDARTKQSIERVLLEAGEKAVDPPMIATHEVIRSDLGLYAGGVTWVDIEYDERLGEALRPVSQNMGGLPFGADMSSRYDSIIQEGMLLNKINLPTDMGTMTAYEVRKRMEQFMRAHMPLFEPVESEYNNQLLNEDFQILKAFGAFPSSMIPDSLSGVELEYTFQSPMKDINNDNKAKRFLEGAEILATAMQIDPAQKEQPNMDYIVRDVLLSLGWSGDWLSDIDKVEAVRAAIEQQMQQAAESEAIRNTAQAAGQAAPMVKAMGDVSRQS